MATARTATIRDRLGTTQALMLVLCVSPLGCGQDDLSQRCNPIGKAEACDSAAAALQPGVPAEPAPSPPVVLTPPPLPGPAVCARVKVEEAGAQYTFPSSHLHLAAAASEAALVYARSGRCGFGTPWTIMLQRLSSSGSLQGEPITLATTDGPGKNEPPPTTLATDGTVFMACWQSTAAGASSIACSTLPVGSNTPTAAAFTDGGGTPALSYGHGSFVLRYHRDQPVLQRLSRTGDAVGDAVLFGQKYFSVSGVSAAVPTGSGFLFGARLASNAPASLQLLDKELRPSGASQAVPFDTGGLLPVADAGAFIYNDSQADPSGYSLRFTPVGADGAAGPAVAVDPAVPASPRPLPFRGAPHHDQLGLLSASYDPATAKERLQFVDLGRNGARSAPSLDLGEFAEESTFSVETFDITRVADGFLVAVMEPASSSRIAITRLSCLDPKSP